VVGGAGGCRVARRSAASGFQTTAIYLHADLTIKERALARLAAPTTPQGRYRPPDALLAFLDAL